MINYTDGFLCYFLRLSFLYYVIVWLLKKLCFSLFFYKMPLNSSTSKPDVLCDEREHLNRFLMFTVYSLLEQHPFPVHFLNIRLVISFWSGFHSPPLLIATQQCDVPYFTPVQRQEMCNTLFEGFFSVHYTLVHSII